MPAGMTVWFDDGVFQIDSETRVATLAYQATFSGPFVSNTGPFVSANYYFDITIPTSVKSLFFYSDTSMFIGLWTRVGTTWRFKCSAEGTIKIYGFADQTITPSTSGLQLFDSAGILTFDSDCKFLRVSDIVRGAASGTTRAWPSTTRNYAAGIGSFPKRGTGAALAGIPYWVQMSYGVSIGPSSAGVGELPISSRPTGGAGVAPPASSPAMQPPTLMIVDVTGF
ncbi:hypothetical protein [Pseudomonas sp. I2]|uniref:hypothetical protein n=1 Tax=Pseudomonas sp. I2 TaxID=1338438 RepID=UPI0034D43A3F